MLAWRLWGPSGKEFLREIEAYQFHLAICLSIHLHPPIPMAPNYFVLKGFQTPTKKCQSSFVHLLLLFFLVFSAFYSLPPWIFLTSRCDNTLGKEVDAPVAVPALMAGGECTLSEGVNSLDMSHWTPPKHWLSLSKIPVPLLGIGSSSPTFHFSRQWIINEHK